MSINYISDRGVEFNASIIEYDIKSANTSVMKYYNLYDIKKLEFFESLPKDKRNKAIGLKLLRGNPELNKKLEKAFTDIINEFMRANNLDKDDDILSIKKDAVFVCNKECPITTFGPVNFVKKNKYHAYIRIDRYEFYVGDKTVDIKGLGDSAMYHKNGISLLIEDIIKTAETTLDSRTINEYIARLCKLYKEKQLDIEIYREFNMNSKFKCNVNGMEMYLDNIGYDYLDNYCDISFNYINIILPLMRLFM